MGQTWTDQLNRVPGIFDTKLPSPAYGTVVTAGNLADERKWHWVPGDVPVENKRYQGYRAGDNAIQEGLMAGSTVYPGTNHTPACQVDAGSDTCLNSPQLKWKAPDSARQADCMFAVLRGICAYHFWDCDASYSDKIFNSVCRDTCDDIPKLCGKIPSTGEDLELARFTMAKYYHMGCTNKRREYIKDCTAAAPPRAPPRTTLLLLLLAAALLLTLPGRASM